MSGILSKNIKIGASTSGPSPTSYTNIVGLQEVPDMGGAADKVDVTTLADGNYKYIKGLVDYGDLEFTFLYDNSSATSNYRVVKGYEDGNTLVYFQVEFPDALTEGTGTHHGTQFSFSGYVSTTIVGQGTNSPLQFKMTITLNSAITVANPE